MKHYRIRKGSIADLVVNHASYCVFALCLIVLGAW